MKNIIFLILLAYSTINAQTPNDIVNSFFDALHHKDLDRLDQYLHDDLTLQSLIIFKYESFKKESKENFIKAIKTIPESTKIEERIHDVKSLESTHLAQFMVPYEFYVNDVFSHKGVNAITLTKIDNKWMITSIVDTRQR